MNLTDEQRKKLLQLALGTEKDDLVPPSPVKKISKDLPKYNDSDEKEIMNNDNVIINLTYSNDKKKIGGLFSNPDGYILYRKSNKKWKWIPVNNFKEVYRELKDKKSYILDSIIGTMDDGKPFFMIDSKIPISLNYMTTSKNINDDNLSDDSLKSLMIDGNDLCYDSKAFDTNLELINLKNMTPKEKIDYSFLKENFIWIILAIIVIIFLVLVFITPLGQQILGNFIKITPAVVQQVQQPVTNGIKVIIPNP